MRITQTTQFKKDLKRQLKRGKHKEKLFEFLEVLVEGREVICPEESGHGIPLPKGFPDEPKTIVQ